MNKTWKRWGALLLALVMALSLFPGSALAARRDDEALPAVPAGDDDGRAAAPVTVETADVRTETAGGDEAIAANDASRDVPREKYTMSAGSAKEANAERNEGPADYAKDGNEGTWWHTQAFSQVAAKDRHITVELDALTYVSALRYKPRSDYTKANSAATPTVNGNGYVSSYEIYVSQDGTNWEQAAQGDWDNFEEVSGRGRLPTGAWQVSNFSPKLAKYVKLVGIHTEGNGQTDQFMHAAEIRVVEAVKYAVSGTVEDADGPKAGAAVTMGGVTSAVTGVDGAFTLMLPSGSYTPAVTLEGYELDGETEAVTVNGGAVSGVTLTVAQVIREVRGVVRAGGAPLKGAGVRLVTGDEAAGVVTTVSEVTTEADGSYVLNVQGVPTGAYKIRAAKSGYGAALSGEPFQLTAGASQTVTDRDAALTAIDPSAADHVFDMTESVPAYTAGSTAAVRTLESGGLYMNFSGAGRATNLVKLEGLDAGDMTVEFDALRGGSGSGGGFGVALRYGNGDCFYVGQDGTLSGWRLESVSGGAAVNGPSHRGPSFAAGEARHFKVRLRQEGDEVKVSLWIDGVAVIDGETAAGAGPTGQGAPAFVSGSNNTTVTVRDLYFTREDPAYTITMPDRLAGYTVAVGAQNSPLKPGEETGQFSAHPGDVVNVYCADLAHWEMSAPLTVLRTADNSLSSTENTLHVTHTGSANKELGYYVQFRMPAYDVTLDPTFKEVEVKEITGVSILRAGDDPEVIDVGGTAELQATVTPAQGVEDLGVTWSSSDPEVVSVEGAVRAEKDDKMDAAYASATVTGLKPGTATVTITTANGKTDTRQVTVGKAVRSVIFPDNTEFTLYTNGAAPSQSAQTTLSPSVEPRDATNAALTWWSTDETVATVDDRGRVTAVAPGTAQIWARSQQNPDAKAYRPVRVVTLPTRLELDVTDVELVISAGSAPGTQVVTPTLTPDDASDKTVRWTTGSAAVATVTKPWAATTGSQNAQITAQGVGTTTITATSVADEGVTAAVRVTVKQRIVGQAAVSGELKFASKLTADVNDIAEAAKSSLTYQWYRGPAATEENKIPQAEGKTYTPTEEDIGSVLTVKVTAGGHYVGETTFTTGEIGKADGYRMEATPTYQDCSGETAPDGKITGLHADRLYEYQPDAESVTGRWTAVDAGSTEISGLLPGTYRVRRAGDGTHLPGSNFETVTISWTGAEDFDIAIPTTFEGGDVTANIRQAAQGAVVTLTVTPDTGYQLAEDGLTVKTAADSSPVTVTAADGEENKFTFAMPGEDVEVDAVFVRRSYTIVHELVNINCSLGAEENHTAVHGERFSVTLTPETGYEMPRALVVTATETGKRISDYTYTADPADPNRRVLTFANGVTGSVTVQGEGVRKTFPVNYVRDRVSFTSAPARASWHLAFAAAVAPDPGYCLPEDITVTMGGEAVAYTYNKESGAIYIADGIVEGDLTISVAGEKETVPLEKASIAGTAQVGQTLTAGVTPAEADGHVTYQWYWVTLHDDGSVAAEEAISSATGRTRSLTEASAGRAVMVRITALEGGGFSGYVDSQPTGVVIAADAAEVLPEQVQIKRERVSVEVGATDTLVAYVGPANATNKTVRWSTSDPAVVTVDNGVITGVAPGTATVTVVTEADETVTDTCAVTVTAPKVVRAGAEDVLAEYDGLPHGIVVAVTEPVDGSASVTYSSDGVNFHSSKPTFSAVGEHTVWYQVTATGLASFRGQAKVTIEKATPQIRIAADPAAPSEGGAVTLTVTVPDYADRAALYVEAGDETLTLTRSEDTVYTVELPADRKTYTFTATLLGTDNYAEATATCTVKVGKSTSGSTTTETKTEPDGTKVTTVTDRRTGTVTETTEKPDGTTEIVETKKDGTVTETVETPDGAKEVVETKPDGTVTETVTDPEGAKTEKVTTPDEAVTIVVTDPEGEEVAKVEIPAEIPEPEEPFVDVDGVNWAKEAINSVAGLGLVKGIGDQKYDPVAPMTRGSLATVLHRLSQGKTDYQATFKDVAKGQYYTEGVAWAAKVKVVTGYTPETFAPDDIITREQLAVMLARYAKLIGMDTTADKEVLDEFVDGEKTGPWAVDGMAWAVKNGILKGKGANDLDPTAKVSRAEVAVMLDRFIKLIK